MFTLLGAWWPHRFASAEREQTHRHLYRCMHKQANMQKHEQKKIDGELNWTEKEQEDKQFSSGHEGVMKG